MAIGPGGAGVLWLHGYPGDANRQLSWLDRTNDAGSSWTAGAAADAIRAHSPASADRFMFVTRATAIGYDGINGVWVTTNAGRSWQHRLIGWVVSDVTAVDGRVQVVAQHCLGIFPTCPAAIFTATTALTRITPLRSQPPRAADYDLVPGAAPIVLVYLPAPRRDWRLAVWSPARGSWATHALPVSLQRVNGSPDISAADATLWLTCLTQHIGMSPADGSYSTYRSTNNGASWTDSGPGEDELAVVSATGRRTAWGEESTISGVTMVRTIDGGRHWLDIVPPPLDQNAAIDNCVESPTTVWCVIQDYESQGVAFSVARTATYGRSWRVTTVPVGRNLPRKAIKVVASGH